MLLLMCKYALKSGVGVEMGGKTTERQYDGEDGVKRSGTLESAQS